MRHLVVYSHWKTTDFPRFPIGKSKFNFETLGHSLVPFRFHSIIRFAAIGGDMHIKNHFAATCFFLNFVYTARLFEIVLSSSVLCCFAVFYVFFVAMRTTAQKNRKSAQKKKLHWITSWNALMIFYRWKIWKSVSLIQNNKRESKIFENSYG